MKTLSALVLSTLCFSTIAFAGATPVAPPKSDRVEIEPGVYGITNTENFEYVCTVKLEDGKTEIKTYLDVDFDQPPGYRFASGFVGGGSYAGMVAAESVVVSATKARCPGLCLTMKVKTEEGEPTNSVTFNEDPITKIISISTDEAGKNTVIGTCAKNEVP